MEDKNGVKNTILAILLSAIVLFAWDYFMTSEKKDVAEQQAIVSKNAQSEPVAVPATGETPVDRVGSGRESLETALSDTDRLKIETPALIGSVNLNDGRIDDLSLRRYRQEVDKNSPPVRLLSPARAENAYYAVFGYNTDGKPIFNKDDKNTRWRLISGDRLTVGKPVIMEYVADRLKVTRTIAVDGDYMFTLSDKVENTSDKNAAVTPYGLIKRDFTTARPQSTYVVHTGLIARVDGSVIERSYESVRETGKERFVGTDGLKGGWIGWTDEYWMTALVPPQNAPLDMRAINAPAADAPGNQADYITSARNLAPGESFTFEQEFFAGSKSVSIIEHYRDTHGIEGFEDTTDWGWFWFFTKPIFKLLHMIQKFVGNYGVSILILTLIIKALFFPLANKSYAAMSKMKKLQPEMEKIRAQYPEDAMKQQQALIELYKREKVNPVSGCWPLLLQIPVFYALYKVLNVTLELRHAPFFGWIQDLSAPDPTNIFNLFGLLPFTPPSFLHIGVLPILMGLTMWAQQKLNPAPPDPTQAKIMGFFPLIFTFVLAPFASGLVLYWTLSNFLSIIQQAIIMKRSGTPVKFHFTKQSADTNASNDNPSFASRRKS